MDPQQTAPENVSPGGTTGGGDNGSRGGDGSAILPNFPQQHFQHPDAPPTGHDGRGNGSNAQASNPAASAGTVARNSFVPGWAVPPRVLLVEDDAVCRKLSSKFLELFGCSIDVAVDGVSAVNKVSDGRIRNV
jgi:CheY-like chemotaxis protein